MLVGLWNWWWGGSAGAAPPVEEVDVFQVSLSIESAIAGTSRVNPLVFGRSYVEANPDV